MKLTFFHFLVTTLFAALLAMLGYEHYLEYGLKSLLIVSVAAPVILMIMAVTFIYTQPEQLDNFEFRASEKGSRMWKDRITELVKNTKQSDD